MHKELLKKKQFQEYAPENESLLESIMFPQKKQSNSDACILIHKGDGRLLLTGKNGIYDNFIRQKFA